MRPIKEEEEDEPRPRERERERGRNGGGVEASAWGEGGRKRKAGVVFDHYAVGLPLLRRRPLPPPSLAPLLIAVGGVWCGLNLAQWSLLAPVLHGSHLPVAFTLSSGAVMLTALSAQG